MYPPLEALSLLLPFRKFIDLYIPYVSFVNHRFVEYSKKEKSEKEEKDCSRCRNDDSRFIVNR